MHPLLQEIRAIDRVPARLRSFGLLVGSVLLALAAVAAWKSGISTWALGLVGAGSLLVVLGQFAPGSLKGPYLVWMALASVLGFVMTRVILTAVFFGLITPIALGMRLLGRDPLHRRIDPTLESYWIARTPDDRRPMTKYF